ncbi:transposase [Xanthomonas translucens pv. arrhenatheri]|nr:hypothetical protein [Xanthomonas translucens]UKE79289.1 transposase [Xanthomonas translucens pv. arrhenatheri]
MPRQYRLDLIETRFQAMLRVAIWIKLGKITAFTILCRLAATYNRTQDTTMGWNVIDCFCTIPSKHLLRATGCAAQHDPSLLRPRNPRPLRPAHRGEVLAQPRFRRIALAAAQGQQQRASASPRACLPHRIASRFRLFHAERYAATRHAAALRRRAAAFHTRGST